MMAAAAWALGTKSTYGAGLLLFHVYCDSQSILELCRCLADTVLLLSFLAACAGAYSGLALVNAVHGLRAWHILYGAPWTSAGGKLAAILTGATCLAPTSSLQEK